MTDQKDQIADLVLAWRHALHTGRFDESAQLLSRVAAVADDYILWGGAVTDLLRTHTRDKCAGQYCCIHNPSQHHMRDWPQHWRDDRGLMERTCKHGIGHPDPDDLVYKVTTTGDDGWGVHGCDGCCHIQVNLE